MGLPDPELIVTRLEGDGLSEIGATGNAQRDSMLDSSGDLRGWLRSSCKVLYDTTIVRTGGWIWKVLWIGARLPPTTLAAFPVSLHRVVRGGGGKVRPSNVGLHDRTTSDPTGSGDPY